MVMIAIMAGSNSSSSPLNSISQSTTSSTDSLVLLNLPIATKLNRSNFLSWQSQIVPLLHGYDLFRFVEAPHPPDPTISSDNVTQLNPAFLAWRKQDQLLLGWLRSSLTEPLLAQVVSCNTAAELWALLHRTFSATSQARLIELQQRLQGISKGGSTCAEYLQQIRSLADELAFVGSPVSDRELVNYTLRGLGTDFNPLVLAVTARSEPISSPDLHALLLSCENRLNSQHVAPPLPAAANPTVFFSGLNPTAMYSNPRPRNPNPRSYQPRSNGPRPQFRPGFSSGFNRPQFRPPFTYQNQQYQQTAQLIPQQQAPPCQICGRTNHKAIDCYFRFDDRYPSSTISHPPPYRAPQPPPYRAPQPLPYRAPPPQAFVAQSSSPQLPHEWCVDSGATHHVTPDLNNLTAFLPFQGHETLQIGNGIGMEISNIGTSTLCISNFSIVLKDMLHVPQFKKNLLSLSKLLQDNSLLIEFTFALCSIKDRQTKTLLLQAPLSKGLYLLHLPLVSSSCPQALYGERASANLWHARLGHTSSSTTLQILQQFSLPCSLHKMNSCSECFMAKSHKLPFVSSSSTSIAPLDLVHSDLWGPSPVVSKDGYRYYVVFVDDFTRYSWLYFLHTKDELSQVFSLFKTKIENLLGCNIKVLRTDGGTEYKPLSRLFPNITFQTTCPYTPQQNGVAERFHRHLVELSLATINRASIPLTYWPDVFHSILYIINRLPSSSINHIPYIKLFNKSPDYAFLKVLGCLCFPYLRPYTNHKLQNRSLPCVFLGYAHDQKGYRCLDMSTNRIYVSRHVVFDELQFPFSNHTGTVQQSTLEPNTTTLLPLWSSLANSTVEAQLIPAHNTFSDEADRTLSGSPDRHTPQTPSSDRSARLASSSPTTALPEQSSLDQPLPHSAHPMTTRTRDNTIRPRLFPDHVAHFTSVAPVSDFEPTTFKQAQSQPQWCEAMKKEIAALHLNNTWTLVSPSASQNIVGCKWVYKIKRHADGSIERFKARLVAKGYTQEEGIDFFDTFSPVIRPMTIRLVLSLAISLGWPLKQLDVHNAFLHGDLHETVYMAQPPGFVDPAYPSHVCRLNKAIYGLKQSPRAWFSTLSSALVAYGFLASNYDPSLFVYHRHGHTVVVLVYVDDIIITGSDTASLAGAISHLQARFALKDLGSLKFFLGIEVSTSQTGIHLSQANYLKDILIRSKMDESRPCASPMVANLSLSLHEGDPMDNPSLYRMTVGALQYATITRPDITFAVNKVSQFMHAPTTSHWAAVKRILRYLKGSLSLGLQLKPDASFTLHAYSDADWAGCPDDRRSTSGFSIFLGPNLISWSAKKQVTVSRSSTEAEYRALALASAELIWLQYLLAELHVSCPSPPILWCDNIGATFLASNPMFHARTKHVEIDYHFIRERVHNKQLVIKFVCSKDQIADIMTKPVTTPRFLLLRDKLTVAQPPSACGGAVSQSLELSSSDITEELQ
ncbi:hypothetical protein LUZ63_009293 [Rhynchospora breviuscula]|uniref:Integrase catalytic domain-containing protein n=1 Tax=Rhynchospora breviuscula TaxID=2022672 RepID=A0A9Q0HP02_9POAL|nr:hypothetical protein LUZ63_009293 [Rhynchospora breviuscula]